MSSPNEGIVRYQALMDSAKYKEAMEFADSKAAAHSDAADEWLDRASKAHCKQIDAERTSGTAQVQGENLR